MVQLMSKHNSMMETCCFLTAASIVLLLFLISPREVEAHGRLIEPPSRSSMWRYGFKTEPNYDDHMQTCGGFSRQHQKNGGKCGICGDPWDGPRPNEAGGIYAKGIIVRKYRQNSIIPISIQLTANHRGYFEFHICPNNDPKKVVSEECLDKHVLEQANGKGPRFYPSEGAKTFESEYLLPKNMSCSQCILQWRYIAANSWGGPCPDGTKEGLGCGPQEEFRACSDISIFDDEEKVGSVMKKVTDDDDSGTKKEMTEAGIQDDEVEDHDHNIPDDKVEDKQKQIDFENDQVQNDKFEEARMRIEADEVMDDNFQEEDKAQDDKVSGSQIQDTGEDEKIQHDEFEDGTIEDHYFGNGEIENEPFQHVTLEDQHNIQNDKVEDEQFQHDKVEDPQTQDDNIQPGIVEDDKTKLDEIQHDHKYMVEDAKEDDAKVKEDMIQDESIEGNHFQDDQIHQDKIEFGMFQNGNAQHDKVEDLLILFDKIEDDNIQHQKIENHEMEDDKIQDFKIQRDIVEDVKTDKIEVEPNLNHKIDDDYQVQGHSVEDDMPKDLKVKNASIKDVMKTSHDTVFSFGNVVKAESLVLPYILPLAALILAAIGFVALLGWFYRKALHRLVCCIRCREKPGLFTDYTIDPPENPSRHKSFHQINRHSGKWEMKHITPDLISHPIHVAINGVDHV